MPICPYRNSTLHLHQHLRQQVCVKFYPYEHRYALNIQMRNARKQSWLKLNQMAEPGSGMRFRLTHQQGKFEQCYQSNKNQMVHLHKYQPAAVHHAHLKL